MRAARIALLLFCLAAGTAQSWIAQLHFHPATQAAPVCAGDGCAAVDAAHAPGQALPGDPGCLLCQVAMHGGGIALAATLAAQLPLPLAGADAPPPPTHPPAASRPSHHWSSRAPPLA